jgi:hypothetical protein
VQLGWLVQSSVESLTLLFACQSLGIALILVVCLFGREDSLKQSHQDLGFAGKPFVVSALEQDVSAVAFFHRRSQRFLMGSNAPLMDSKI